MTTQPEKSDTAKHVAWLRSTPWNSKRSISRGPADARKDAAAAGHMEQIQRELTEARAEIESSANWAKTRANDAMKAGKKADKYRKAIKEALAVTAVGTATNMRQILREALADD